ncbi:MAG: hypothetical protein IJI01_05795 [Butyrivibrio sp.]|uniref:DUF5688 family protein n=1 Tax=Butyrivibrio sp. TaxID=28121 RepID=UPI0025C5A187|nr:DUF5688 family protein [Butyrivibrio sp.]MBQ6588172.1 hypothetical protein [Butyrivibrio sp.]
MRIEDFGMVVADEIRGILGSEYSIEYKEVGRNNGVTYHALLIKREGDNISPTIYIDGFFHEYERGTDRSKIVNDIIRLYRENAIRDGFDASFYTDFSNVCSRLAFKVTNYERNKKALLDLPYKKMEDLAFVPICLVSDKILGEGNITIKNEHLRKWEISFDELWENVWENAAKIAPVKRRNLFDIAGNVMGDGTFFCEDLPRNMFVITNCQEMFGASAVFYPGYLEELALEMGSDMVIIPSSVHETIVMSAPDDRASLSELIAMVKEVNRTVLAQEDFLSDCIYLYKRQEKKIVVVHE